MKISVALRILFDLAHNSRSLTLGEINVAGEEALEILLHELDTDGPFIVTRDDPFIPSASSQYMVKKKDDEHGGTIFDNLLVAERHADIQNIAYREYRESTKDKSTL